MFKPILVRGVGYLDPLSALPPAGLGLDITRYEEARVGGLVGEEEPA